MIFLTLNDMEQTNVMANELYTLQLPSTTESLTLVENLVEELADKYKVGEDVFANMMTCLNEAVINAIIHGNKLDPAKKVFVNAEADAKRIIWTIDDHGVFILKHLADQCIFNAKGNQVELHFKI
jgi:serine/threonine-protein kinase RsbW